MNIFSKKTCLAAFALILSACTTNNQVVDNSAPSPQTKHTVSYEPQKGRLTPEISVARALKYNLETVKNQLSPKIIGKSALDNARKNFQKMRESQNEGLATSLKELDFALLYTGAYLQKNEEDTNDLLTLAAAQNIILASLKSHESALFNRKKLFEYNRQKRQYQNQIASLLKKKQNLNDEDLAYKKQLEDSIDALTYFQQNAQQNIDDFYLLTKFDDKNKPEPEGRNFYEKNILSPSNNAESYIKSAFTNRNDLKNLPPHSFEDISLNLTDLDFDITPAVSGFYIPNTAYEQNLSTIGSSQASKLLTTFLNYQKDNDLKKNKNLAVLSEEFHKAVYLQVKIAYQLALRTAADYDTQQSNIKQIKANIRKLEKINHASPEQRLELLKSHIDLIENEILAEQIYTERSLTAIALQFYGGLLKISTNELNQEISSLADSISKNIQNKPLTTTEKRLKEKPAEQMWAHGENWLEQVITEQHKPLSSPIMSKTVSSSPQKNNQTSLQMGTFLDIQSADKEWLELKKLCPELEQYTPIHEKTSVAGISLYRLVIKYSTGNFKNICTCLHNHNKECLLRD